MGLLYSVYLDASGKPETDASLVVAGAVAPVKNWIRFERAWKSVLDDEGVSEFHATDFAASQGEYRKWKGDKDRRASFLKRLREIIEKNVNRLFMVTVEIEAWTKVNRDYLLEEGFHSPYALAGFSAVAQLRKWAKKKKIKSPVEIVFEEGDDGWDGLTELCKRGHVIPIRLPKQKPCRAKSAILSRGRSELPPPIRCVVSVLLPPLWLRRKRISKVSSPNWNRWKKRSCAPDSTASTDQTLC